MKIAEINTVDYGSTGKIMFHIAQCARERGHIVRTFSKKWRKQVCPNEFHSYYGTTLENGIHIILYRLIGFQGLFSWFGTRQLVKQLEEFRPDVIHLHNLHDSNICLPILFNYIKKNCIPVVWTLHDCWAFTGQCTYFDMSGCNRWISGCGSCPQLTAKLPVDCSRYMWKKKQGWFTGVRNMIFVTPSQWLAGLVKQSFLKEYPVQVINNGIDLSVFKPTSSDFRERYGIGFGQYILLGVAFGWGTRKGLDVFVELSQRLDQKKYQIVLVGTDDVVDKLLPENIISIHRTQNQTELAEIYTAADLFVNPTREEVLGMVNIEANACGTPVITFRTGGSPECIDNSSGSVVDREDIDAMEHEIRRICTEKAFSEEDCLERAKFFCMNERFQEYVSLYSSL